MHVKTEMITDMTQTRELGSFGSSLLLGWVKHKSRESNHQNDVSVEHQAPPTGAQGHLGSQGEHQGYKVVSTDVI